MTCWRRLREWREAGLWQRLHGLLLAKLNEADRIDWSRAAIDSSHVRAFGGAKKTGPSPVDRARSGSKHHLIACGRGTPLAVSLTGGNRNDITQMVRLVDAMPPVRGRRGRPRRHPRMLYGDRAYHSREGRNELRRRHIPARIAWPKSPHGSGLGAKRWVFERTTAWLHQYRRLRIRYKRRDDTHEAFLAIGCSLICLKLLQAEESIRSLV
jgi:transposase